ncbi:MAG: DUF3955 domain-containing protein [Verrucomicrobia bacterium]|jgi:hypothetical protein|nr:DUF3955 domain-containing protein [Opitutales bacterium]NBV52152.1 DUF3955 domain-containing protein [Verrucomicrobiota bacterium]
MNRRYFIAAILCFSVSWVCWTVCVRIGSTVGPDGVLHEPFGLIPLGWLFDFVGLVLLALAWVRRK